MDDFETRTRLLFDDSTERVDMAVRSRLTQARYAALDAASANGRPWWLRAAMWAPMAGVAAAALLGVALWAGLPGMHSASGVQSNFEVLDMVASSDGGSSDALEMLQDDIDFYDFADMAGSSEPAA